MPKLLQMLEFYWLYLRLQWLRVQLVALHVTRFYLLTQLYGFRAAIALHGRRRVEGHSMEPILRSGDFIAARAITPQEPISRGQILVFREPIDRTVSVKRVCGLPGEVLSLDDDGLTVDGERTPEPYVSHSFRPQGRYDPLKWTLGPDEFIMLGDNRFDSLDSREYGPIRRDSVIGLAWYRYAPDGRTGPIPEEDSEASNTDSETQQKSESDAGV